MKKIKFRGFDWSELAPIFGLDANSKKYNSNSLNLRMRKDGLFLDEGRLYDDICIGLENLIAAAFNETNMDKEWRARYTKEDKAKTKLIRQYVRKLDSPRFNCTAARPLWVGLSNIKNDCTFLQYVKDLLRGMWS